MSGFKNLDDFGLCHQTNIFTYKKILEQGELKSTSYLTEGKSKEGGNMGGNPNKIYFTLIKLSKLKTFEKNPLRMYDVKFYLDPRILLKYKDKIEFSPSWNYGKKGIKYHSFEKDKEPLKGFEDLYPENEEEELALNLNYFYSLFEEDIVGQKSGQNEITIEADVVPINDYLIDVSVPPKYLFRGRGMNKALIDKFL